MELKIPPPCDETMGFVLVEKGEQGTIWEWTPDERFANPAGTVHGGLIGAFLDTVNGATLIRALGERRAGVTTIEQKTSFFHPVQPGTTLRGEGRTVAVGGRLAFLESLATDPEGRVVAAATATWILLPRG